MRNLSKITSNLILSIALLVAPNLATAALTVGSTSVTSDGAITLNGAAGSNVLFGTTATTGNISIGTALTSGTYNVGGTSQTGTITVGLSTASNTISIGSGIIDAGATQIIYMGSPTDLAATSTALILIGSANRNDGTQKILIGHTTDGGAGTSNIYLGTSRSTSSSITFAGHWQATDSGVSALRITTASIAGAGTTGKTVAANSTDTTGSLTTGSEAHTAVVVTFKGSYGAAPQCIINAANAAAAAVTGVYVATTTSNFTINSASSSTNDKWNWLCIESTNAQAF
jgi:hypothetical protein